MKKKSEVLLMYKGVSKVLLLIFMGVSLAGFAKNNAININRKAVIQERVITGIVTDKNNVQLPGVSVVVKGGTIGTTTDMNGKYSIVIANDDVLIFKYLGFVSQEKSIGATSTLNIVLTEDVALLDEVVVVGYGTQNKKDLTGSVVVVKGEDIEARSTTNVSSALQGAVSGVSVTRGGSAPGAGTSIRIRGTTTILGSSDPLILVDDIPVGSIDDVNPDQIESISVLKDGASASIYGSRAAAGVILITTKQAKAGKFSTIYSGEYLVNTPTQIRRSVDAVRYLQLFNEQSWNDARNVSGSEFLQYDEAFINSYNENNKLDPDNFPNTNWSDLVLKKNSTLSRHSLTLSGGSEKIKTSANFGHESQDALYANRDWERITGRINNNLKISEKFGADFNVAFKLTEDNQPSMDPTRRAIESAPIYPALWQDGRLAEGKQGDNIYAQLREGGSSTDKDYLLYGKFGVFYKPIKSLKLAVNIAPKYNFSKYKNFRKEIPYWAADNPEEIGDPAGYMRGFGSSAIRLNENRLATTTLTTQALVNYDEVFGDHTINAILGYEEFSSEIEKLSVLGSNYLDNSYPFLSIAPLGQIFDDGSSISELAYRSVFSRVAYDFDKKYFIQGSIRRDGSSRFGSDYRFGYFPSVAAGWVVSEENFMEPLKNTISFLKFRGSYGSLGNDRLNSNYLYQAVIQLSDVLITKGDQIHALRSGGQVDLAIPDITWETTNSLNFGVDLNIFKDKLSVTADVFNKKTKDMLLGLSILRLVGYPDPDFNVGSMSTNGWETSATWRDQLGDFRYSVSANISDSKSIIDDIDGKKLISGNVINIEGQEFNTYYGLKSDGIFNSQDDVDNSAVTNSNVKPGDVKYKDISGPNGVPDGVINDEDKTFLGGSLPRFQYGGNVNIFYKDFDFGLVFQGVGKSLLNIGSGYIEPFKEAWLAPTQLYESAYWSVYNTTEENLNANYPRLSQTSQNNNYRFSDFYLKKASYLRVKNLTIGYTLSPEVFKSIGLSQIRIYASGNDLFTFDNLPEGIDPEQNSGSYLITKSYILGVKVNF